VPQRLGSDTSLSPGARFSLRDFTGENYRRGRPSPVQLLWMVVSRCVTMQWWCPNRLRVFILRRFGARVRTGTLMRHDVKIHWLWRPQIGHHTLDR
jgi:putative colanic acid biosynthesis acetyltransferase WcaF